MTAIELEAIEALYTKMRDSQSMTLTDHRNTMERLVASVPQLLAEVTALRGEVERWDALGERHGIKLRDLGCKCDREEGDSACPVHGDESAIDALDTSARTDGDLEDATKGGE